MRSTSPELSILMLDWINDNLRQQLMSQLPVAARVPKRRRVASAWLALTSSGLMGLGFLPLPFLI